MPLALTRIDDRLIHGQVVVGWGNYLKPNRIILCCDSVAKVPWQKEMYNAAGSLAVSDITISIWTEKETVNYFKKFNTVHETVILLVEAPHELFPLIEQNVPIEVVNVGGMHFKRGKRQLAPYIFVDDKDIESFKSLLNRNITLEGQDVPTSKKINIVELLELL